MPNITTLTLNPCVDKNTAVYSVASEIKLRCESPTYDPGGGGVNVSRAIHKLGGTATTVLALGGSTGDTLRGLLEQERLLLHVVPAASWTRENLVVFEKSTTLQYRFGMPGGALTEAELAALVAAVLATDADYIVASGSLPANVPDDFYATLTRQAQATGARVIIDTSEKALEAMMGAGAFLLKPNIHELEILSGEKFEGEEQMVMVARRLITEKMAEVFVVSLGAQGAALITKDDFVLMQPPVVPVKSKVGAGDSMVGGIVRALAHGERLVDAVRYGIAAGTACVMTPGTELCRKEDVEQIYPRVKVTSSW